MKRQNRLRNKTIQRRPAYIEQAVQAAVDDQTLQITAPNLSNCNLNLIFISDTEVTSVCVPWSLDDTVLKTLELVPK